MNEKEIHDHTEFLAKFACQIASVASAGQHDKPEAIADFVEFLAEGCFTHAVKHCREGRPDILSGGDRVRWQRKPGKGWEPGE